MVCPNCKTQNNDTAEYCYNCGCRLNNNIRNSAANMPSYMPPTSGTVVGNNNPPASSKTADRFAVLSFAFALASLIASVLLVVLLAVADILISKETSFFSAGGLSYIIPLIIFPHLVLSIVFSFIATAKKTQKKKFAIAARIIAFSEIGISMLVMVVFFAFLLIAAMHGPYY